MLNLEREQYTGKGFTRVAVKGGAVRDFVPMQREARTVLEEWLDRREDVSPPLFVTRNGRRLSRREAAAIVRRIAAQANAHLSEEEQIDVSPHVLRHTFLHKLAETKGVQYAKEASRHQSDRYIWRYVRPDRQTLAVSCYMHSLSCQTFLVIFGKSDRGSTDMQHAHYSLDKPLEQRLLALAESTDQDIDAIIHEALSKHLDEQEKARMPKKGFKDVLRSWSLDDLDLERVPGQDRADIECE